MNVELIKNAPLFVSLSHEEQQLLASRMRLEQYRRDEVIFGRGDPSRALYLIQSGWVKLVAESGTIIANLGPGSLVGEADVLLGRPRTIEARATTDVEVLTLSGYNLEALIGSHPQLGLNISVAFGARIAQLRGYLVQRLKPSPLLAQLAEEELLALADKLYPKDFAQGTFLFQEGDPPKAMYVLESGIVRLVDSTLTTEAGADLRPGEVFGESALVTNTAYPVAAYAIENAVVWVLDAADFDELTIRYPSVRKALSKRLQTKLGARERALALEMLRAVDIFADLPPDVLLGIAGRLLIRHVPEGELVYVEGAPGDAMFIVRSGEVKVTATDAQDAEVLEYYRQGDAFGQVALLTGKPRTDVARATVNTNLLVLTRPDFDELLVQFPALSVAVSRAISQRLDETRQSFADRQLGRMPILSGFSKSELLDLAHRVRPVHYRAGELIFAQGTPGEVMYFIESGQVRIATRIGQRLTTLAVLGRGEFFGEMSLLTGNLRSAMAQAVSDVDLWALHQKDLDELMRKVPALAIGIGRVLSQRLSRASEMVAEAGSGSRAALGGSPTTSRSIKAEPERKAIPARAASRSGEVAADHRNAVSAQRQPSQFNRRVRTSHRVSEGELTKAGTRGRRSASFGQRIVEGLENASTWFATRSLAVKLQLVGVLLLFVWLCGISAPATVISAFSQNDVGLRNMAFLQTVTPIPTNTPIPTPTPSVTPTPTNSPTPTDTPTTTPTFTPLPPTDTPIPTNTPRPVVKAPPTDTPTPPGPTNTPVPEVDYKLVKVRRLTACENKGGHNIYINVIDKDGNGIPGVVLWVSWGGGGVEVTTGNKPERGPGWTDFPMFKGTHTVQVKGAKSEIATGITPDIPVDEPCPEVGSTTGNSLYHYSYEVVFQRTY